MKKNFKFLFVFLFLMLMLIIMPNIVKAAEAGTTMANPVIISFDEAYTKTWEKNSDHLNCFNKVTLSSQGLLKMTFSKPIDTEGEYGRLQIIVYDEDGNIIWDADSYSSVNSASPMYNYYVGLNKGTYYVTIKPIFEVISGVLDTVYKFSFTNTSYCEIEPNETSNKATSMALNHMYSAYICNDGGDADNIDYYKFALTKGVKYRIIMENLEANNFAIYHLFEPDSKEVSMAEYNTKIDSDGNRYYEFIANQTGNYFFKIYNYSSYDAQMPYKLGVYKYVQNISECEIKLTEKFDYTGKAITPAVTVKNKAGTLVKGTDYTLTYKNNINAGTATVSIAGKGNFSGTVNKTFTINAKAITICDIQTIPSQTYTGKALKPNVTIKNGSMTLKNGTDYTLTYKNNINAGTATVTITGIKNYRLSINKSFYIQPKDIKSCTISGISNKTYNGNRIEPNITVKFGSVTLKKGTDYSVNYKNNRNVGTATIEIKGRKNFTGTVNKTFKILPIQISACSISSVSNQYYTGKAFTPQVTVKYKNDKLYQNSDYSITYKNNKNVGIATITITGKGKYGGSVTRNFNILPTTVKSLSTSKQTYNYITLKWKKDTTVTGYEVYMSTSKNGTYKKVSTITKNSTVSYKKTGLSAGKTYYFKVRAYKTVSGKKLYGKYSSILTTTTATKKPSTPTVKSSSKKTANISWKKVSGATGYEVYMREGTKGSFKKITTLNSAKKVSYKKTGLKSKKTYYFKVRTYRTVNGKKVYSDYSSTKSVKIK